MPILVVIPVTEAELPTALANLRWIEQLDGKQPFHAIIAAEGDFSIDYLVEAAKRCFGGVTIFRYDIWNGPKEWPHPQNYAWQTVARHIEAGSAPSKQRGWLWWEQDAIPLKAGWLHELDSAYTAGAKPFAGAVTCQSAQHYVAGVAIYPTNISQHLYSALLTTAQPFDKVASVRDGMLRKTHDITPLICHESDTSNTPFSSLQDVVSRIPDSAVLFHKNKDGSLLDVLEGRTPVLNPVTPGVPSFTQQTQWESGLFTFPASNVPTAYYNCSIVEHEKKRWLFTRRQRFNTEQSFVGSNTNDLAIWEIRPNMSLSPTPIIPLTPNRHMREQWEDPRAYSGSDGHTYVSFATWVHHKDWFIRQSFCRLSSDWKRFDVVSEPIYGGNHPTPTKCSKHEKNWVWFEHEGEWRFVYSVQPHEVVSTRTGVSGIHDSFLKLPWQKGEPRGGTPPIRIGDEYLCFFHSALVWRKPKRRYYMGAYTFGAHPPFDIKRITLEPLLAGSEEDFRALGGPLVIFPNGALREPDGSWLVVFGVNDEGCGWLRIPHNDLEKRMVAV